MFDVDRLMKVMSEILSDRYDCKITMTAIPKDHHEVTKRDDCPKEKNEKPLA